MQIFVSLFDVLQFCNDGVAHYKFQNNDSKYQFRKTNHHCSIMAKRLSIAPMIGFTNSHFRTFARILTKRATLYTEMVHMNAVVHNHEQILPFNQVEHPLVLQLGGNHPDTLHKAAEIASSYGYDSINFNVGCPSTSGLKGSFGAVLMKNPDLVKTCLLAMKEGGKIPVSLKCRLGVDHEDSYQFSKIFISKISNNGKGPINHFIIHARKVYLNGLSTQENRTIPPLQYDRVVQLKKQFPSLYIEVNGGIEDIKGGYKLIEDNNLDGCMIGRLSLNNPFELLRIDQIFYGQPHELCQIKDPTLIRFQILKRYASYLEQLEKKELLDRNGKPLKKSSKMVLFRPLLNLYTGQLWGNKFRQYLSEKTIFENQPSSSFIRQTADWITKETIKTRQLLSTLKEKRNWLQSSEN